MEDKRTPESTEGENTENIQEEKAAEAEQQVDAGSGGADCTDAPPAEGKRKWSAKKKAAVGVVAAVIVAGLGIGCWYAWDTGQSQPAAQEQKAEKKEASDTDVEKLAKEPRPVGVSIKADGWKPENGTFTLVVKDDAGDEAAKLAVMPDGNGGMSAKDAIEALPEDQFDAAKEAYKKDDGIAESPVLKLEPGEYTAELADMPTLEDGSTYKLPDAVSFKVKPMEKKGDESIAAKVEFSLEKIDPEDEEAVEAAIETLPEEKREAARQQYQKKAEQKQQAASGGGSAGSGSSSGSGSNNSGGGSGNGGGSTEPQRPAHTRVYDTPITERQWQDGEGYQRVERWMCSVCKQKFSSAQEIDNHIWSTYGDVTHPDGATAVNDSYDTWTKEPGYYDVVVGYKCSCGAVR